MRDDEALRRGAPYPGDQRHARDPRPVPGAVGDEGYRVSTDAFAADLRQTLETIRKLVSDLVVPDFIIGREGLGWQLLQAMKMDRGL
jgi:hypothetical protein